MARSYVTWSVLRDVKVPCFPVFSRQTMRKRQKKHSFDHHQIVVHLVFNTLDQTRGESIEEDFSLAQSSFNLHGSWMIKRVAYLELNRKKCVEKWPSDGDVGQSFPWDSHSQCCTSFSSFSISSCLSSSLDLQFQARTKDLQHSIPSLSLSPFLTSINAFPFCWQSNKSENPHLILSFLQRVHALLSFWHVNQWDWEEREGCSRIYLLFSFEASQWGKRLLLNGAKTTIRE